MSLDHDPDAIFHVSRTVHTWQAIDKPNCYMPGCDFDTYGDALPVNIQGQLFLPRAL